MTTTTPKHRLRWYQYSLRSLFVLTVLVAAVGSWFAWKKQQVERQRAAVKWVEESGGLVIYDWMTDASGNEILNAQPPGPDWLRAWMGDDFLSRVIEVDLFGPRVTDARLEHLKGLTHLRQLALVNTRVTDAGLEHLGSLTQLEVLTLQGMRVTDAGLEHLKGLAQLEELYLTDTKVTLEGVKKLQEALPNCKIVR